MGHCTVVAQVAIAIRRHYQGPCLGPEQGVSPSVFTDSFPYPPPLLSADLYAVLPPDPRLPQVPDCPSRYE